MRHLLALSVLVFFAACTRVGFDATSDGSILDSGPRDATLDRVATDSGPRDATFDSEAGDVAVDSVAGDVVVDSYQVPPGSLDPSFGGTGFVVQAVSASTSDLGKRVVVDGQGRVLLGGQAVLGVTPGNDVYVARYTTAGALDTSFGGGVVTVDLNGANDSFGGLAVDGSGRIVGGGGTNIANDGAIAVFRLRANGTLDSTFATGGELAIQVSGAEDELTGLVLDSQGRIVFAGSANDGSDFVVGRVTSSGVPDSAFGSSGIATAFVGTRARAWGIALASGDRPVAAGWAWQGATNKNDVAIARFVTNGGLDMTFGVGGETLVDVANNDDLPSALALDGMGRTVISGKTIDGSSRTRILAARVNANGTLDSTFGSGGSVRVAAGTSDEGREALVDASGRLVIVGETQAGADIDLVIVRLLADGSPDTSLGPQGFVTVDLDGRNDYTRGAVFDPQGRLLVAGWIDEGALSDSFVARFEM